MKKGQITPFIIMGLLILILLSLVFYISSMARHEALPTERTEATRMELRSYIEGCVEMVSTDSVKVMGLQGGYISQPEKIFWHNQLGTSILYSQNKTYMPTIGAMEANLSAYIKTFLPYCTNLSLFPGHQITTEDVQAETNIQDQRVLFKIYWPVTYRQGSASTTITDWETDVPIDLMKFQGIAENIVMKTKKDPSYIDHIFLLSQAMNISYAIYNDTIVYDLKDVSIYKDDDFEYIFAVETT